MSIGDLQTAYFVRKDELKARIREFKKFYSEPFVWSFEGDTLKLIPSLKQEDERLFEELCFCILTANTSAELSLKTIDKVRDHLILTDEAELSEILKDAKYRFYNRRANYIVEARRFLQEKHNFELKKLLESYKNNRKLRDYLVEHIKGLGYKEASHFLRNVGFKDLAILDKHIINTFCGFGLCESKPPANRQMYLEIEQDLEEFAQNLNIDFDELDLLIWSLKTGRILK